MPPTIAAYTNITWLSEARAPVEAGQVLGVLTFYPSDEEPAKYNLIATRSVKARGKPRRRRWKKSSKALKRMIRSFLPSSLGLGVTGLCLVLPQLFLRFSKCAICSSTAAARKRRSPNRASATSPDRRRNRRGCRGENSPAGVWCGAPMRSFRRAKPSNEAREFARQRAQRASGVAEERNEKISDMDKRSVLEGGF